jgi:hypothetical protein
VRAGWTEEQRKTNAARKKETDRKRRNNCFWPNGSADQRIRNVRRFYCSSPERSAGRPSKLYTQWVSLAQSLEQSLAQGV